MPQRLQIETQAENEEPILLPLRLELNETLKKLPCKGRVFDARNLRKSFQAACVKVGLGVIAIKISEHLTESTFESYNIVDSTDLYETMAKVEKYFDGS
jgi:hypothetical protein